MAPSAEQMLGTLVEQNRNLEKNLDNHMREDHERFERTFKYLGEKFDKMDGRFDKFETKLDERFEPIETKIGTLWDGKNKQEGAFSLGRVIVGSVGGVLGAIIMFAADHYVGKGETHASNTHYENQKVESGHEELQGRNI